MQNPNSKQKHLTKQLDGWVANVPPFERIFLGDRDLRSFSGWYCLLFEDKRVN